MVDLGQIAQIIIIFLPVCRVNLFQSVYLVQYALSHLNSSQGIIVPISSGSGENEHPSQNTNTRLFICSTHTTGIAGIPKVAPYGTSKHALQGTIQQ